MPKIFTWSSFVGVICINEIKKKSGEGRTFKEFIIQNSVKCFAFGVS